VEVALIGAVMALILLFSGPQTKEVVIVLPDASGHVGTVVVEHGDERVILNEAYATSRITADGAVRLEKLPQREVESSFSRTVTALPPRPASFFLYFITGTDILTEASKGEFQRMLEELRKRQAPDIVVIGHTDRVGNEEANDELSLQRAERVKSDLVSQGIAAPERVRAAGRGEREPVVPTENGVDEPLNRRVEINVR
jgi:outer membrane protein OmpA-like peptidoglycan-associated protein